MHKPETRKALHDCHSLTSGIHQMLEVLSSVDKLDPSDLDLMVKHSASLTSQLKNLSSITTPSRDPKFPEIDLNQENQKAEQSKDSLFTTYTYFTNGWLKNPFRKTSDIQFEKGWDSTCAPSFIKWMEENYYPKFPDYYTREQAKEDLDFIRPRVDDRHNTVAYRVDGKMVGILLFDNRQSILNGKKTTHVRFAFVDVQDANLRETIKHDMIETINASTDTPCFSAFIGHYNIASQKFFSKLGMYPTRVGTEEK